MIGTCTTSANKITFLNGLLYLVKQKYYLFYTEYFSLQFKILVPVYHGQSFSLDCVDSCIKPNSQASKGTKTANSS